jgi:hypothetical protein
MNGRTPKGESGDDHEYMVREPHSKRATDETAGFRRLAWHFVYHRPGLSRIASSFAASPEAMQAPSGVPGEVLGTKCAFLQFRTPAVGGFFPQQRG